METGMETQTMEGAVRQRWPRPDVEQNLVRDVTTEHAAAQVVEINDRPAFVALAAEWDALVAQTDDQIFYRHSFIRVWIDNFAPTARLRVLTLRGKGGQLLAVLPLIEQRTRLYGVPVRELCAAANQHSCRFDLVARDPEAAATAFFAHLKRDQSWDVIRLTDVPEGGAAFGLLKRAEQAGLPVGRWTSLQSPFIALPQSWEAMQKQVDTKFRANLRRRRKRLEEKGKVTVERITQSPDLARLLEEGYALEQSGWKGRGGTAIAQDNATRGFYSELARTAAAEGKLTLFFMRLDGRAVGFHYALEHAGRYLLLKPAYDELIRECSPGQLLMEDVLKTCVEKRLPEFDFLGPDMPWKRDWTNLVRTHSWLYIFRENWRGRALHGLKFRWLPALKDRVNRWKR